MRLDLTRVIQYKKILVKNHLLLFQNINLMFNNLAEYDNFYKQKDYYYLYYIIFV